MTANPPRRRLIVAAAMIVLGLVGGIGGSMFYMWTRADQATTMAEDLCAQVEGLGRTCVEDPAELQGAEGPPGPQGDTGPGPTDAQVYDAVSSYLSNNPVTSEGPSSAEIAVVVANYLRDFPPGPTPEQVSAAVVSYLTANPPAEGEPGADGADGADGATGPPGPAGPEGAQGETGPPPSPEDVASAVQAWMEANPFPDCYEEGWAWEPYTVLTTVGGVDTVLCVAA